MVVWLEVLTFCHPHYYFLLKNFKILEVGKHMAFVAYNLQIFKKPLNPMTLLQKA